MAKGSSKESTLEHKRMITELMNTVIVELLERATVHDNAKMEDPELALFDEYTPKLAKCTFGSDEYKTFLKDLQPALEHHYARYRHHPEHFPEGCKDMNILDIVEMLVDWKAASLRHNDGNILKSLESNRTRFGLDKVSLYDIMLNSIELFEEHNT
jgi:hypothetical protein